MKFPRILFQFLSLSIIFLVIGCSDDDNPVPDDNPNGRVPPQFPCENGMADIYPCDGYDLMSHIGLETFESQSGNDSWGWTDPTSGKEYALMGLNDGTAFVDISNPAEPIYLGKLPTATVPSTWRDIKTYQNHAFIVSEAQNHGMQVFDLTKLRDVENPPIEFTADAHYTGFGDAHNLAINEETGYAYAIGTNTFAGGPHFVNIQNPTNPVGEGGFAGQEYTHDAQIVVYKGADADYTGREIFFGSNEKDLAIIDVTDKSNPTVISTIDYKDVGYTHQAWLTENHKYLLLGDEFDEGKVGFNTRTIVFDLADLDNPVVGFEYFGPTPAIDHNGYVDGDVFYLSNYTAGLRIIDISGIENGNIAETGYFDTYPEGNPAAFNGVWSNYPFFESGNIVVSDINRGLFVVRKK